MSWIAARQEAIPACASTVSVTPWKIIALCTSKRHHRFFALRATAARADRCDAAQPEASSCSGGACRLNVDIIESYEMIRTP